MTNKIKKLNKKLWGAAFKQRPSEAVIKFTAGRDVYGVKPADYKLLPYDLWGSKAHCVMLLSQKIISKKDAQVILKGLSKIEKLSEEGKFVLDPAKEDVHTNIESYLIEKYGIEHAGKLHTARSRNDQCSLDTKLYLKDQVLAFVSQIISLSKTLTVQAEKYQDCVMPGFTHHQHAMVTTFGHVLLSFASMIARDSKRLTNWFNLHNFNPLGSIAAYGTIFSIDQKLTTKLLGFDSPSLNSLDEITNKWEAESDLAFAISCLMNHLSLMAQTLIIFSTPEFDMVKLSDQFSTGSSIMPQKKNPDSLEVIKAKASLAAGFLGSLLSMGKGNFIGYNRDLQWTKYLIMDLVNECLPALAVMEVIVKTMKIDKEKMAYWCESSFVSATSLLEQIVTCYKLPFRKAKVIIEKAVKYSKDKGKVSYFFLQKALKEEGVKIELTPGKVKKWQDPKEIIKLTKSFGGPGVKSVQKASTILFQEIKKQQKWLKEKNNQKKNATQLLEKEVKRITGNTHQVISYER